MRALRQPWRLVWLCGSLLLGLRPAAAQPGAPPGAEPRGMDWLVRQAISASAELAAERSMLGLRHGAWMLSLRNFLPGITLDLMDDRRLALSGPDSLGLSLNVGLNQPLWDGGQALAARRLESQELALAMLQLRRKEQALADAVVQAVRSLAASRQRLAIRQRSLDGAAEQFRLMTVESGLGLTLERDLLAAGLQLDELRLEMSSGLLDLREAELQLLQLIGLDVLPAIQEEFALDSPQPRLDADAFCALALARSLDLTMQRQAIARRQVEREVQRWSWLPNVGLRGSLRFSGDDLPLTELSWNIGLSFEFSLPLAASSLGLSGGSDGRGGSNLSTSLRGQVAPAPTALLDPARLALALQAEVERLQQAEAALRLRAGLLVQRYSLTWQRRDLAGRRVNLQRDQLAFMELEQKLGRLTRAELLAAGLKLAEYEIAQLDAHLALLAAGRELERLAELEVGGLNNLASGEMP